MGRCCPKHGRCKHYHAVEGMTEDDPRLIDSCERGGQWPEFEAVDE